jgi:hypothetical protein
MGLRGVQQLAVELSSGMFVRSNPAGRNRKSEAWRDPGRFHFGPCPLGAPRRGISKKPVAFSAQPGAACAPSCSRREDRPCPCIARRISAALPCPEMRGATCVRVARLDARSRPLPVICQATFVARKPPLIGRRLGGVRHVAGRTPKQRWYLRIGPRALRHMACQHPVIAVAVQMRGANQISYLTIVPPLFRL